jgi:hypothetical protein
LLLEADFVCSSSRELLNDAANKFLKETEDGSILLLDKKLHDDHMQEEPQSSGTHGPGHINLLRTILEGSTGFVHHKSEDCVTDAIQKKKLTELLTCVEQAVPLAAGKYISELILNTQGPRREAKRPLSCTAEEGIQSSQRDAKRLKASSEDQKAGMRLNEAAGNSATMHGQQVYEVEEAGQCVSRGVGSTSKAVVPSDSAGPPATCNVPGAVAQAEPSSKSCNAKSVHDASQPQEAVRMFQSADSKVSHEQQSLAMKGNKQQVARSGGVELASSPLVVTELNVAESVSSLLELMKATEGSLKCSMLLTPGSNSGKVNACDSFPCRINFDSCVLSVAALYMLDTICICLDAISQAVLDRHYKGCLQ